MQNQKGFRQMLAERQNETGSVVCVGLDPLPEKLPPHLITGKSDMSTAMSIADWMIGIVDGTASVASVFKPQKAYYEAFRHGDFALQRIVNHIKMAYPDIPIFLDAKRGDIGRTQERYKVAHFEIDGAHGMNFSPYMGKDCMEFLVDKDNLGRAIVGLCYTSNPAAREVQDVIMSDGRAYWEFIAEITMKWADQLGIIGNAGLVMAAAYEKQKGSGVVYSQHLSRCREIVGNKLWFLIPGVGTQGGFVEETMNTSFTEPGSIAINSSSEINFASQGKDFAEAAAEKAKQLHLATQF